MDARHTRIPTVLGQLTLTADDTCLTGVYFEGHWYPPSAEMTGRYVDVAQDPVLGPAEAELVEYLAGRRRDFSVRTRAIGDPFSQDVWRRIREIPYGATTSYGEIARSIGNPALAQRVGQAVGHNPLSIVVPCHRVVGASGALTGYAGGLSRKAFLLDLEAPAEVTAGRLF